MDPTARPPNRCPNCGALPCEETKRQGYTRRPGREDLRYPAFFSHRFPCGALIEAEFVVKNRLTGGGGGAYWELRTVTGCRHATHQALQRPILLRERGRRRA